MKSIREHTKSFANKAIFLLSFAILPILVYFLFQKTFPKFNNIILIYVICLIVFLLARVLVNFKEEELDYQTEVKTYSNRNYIIPMLISSLVSFVIAQLIQVPIEMKIIIVLYTNISTFYVVDEILNRMKRSISKYSKLIEDELERRKTKIDTNDINAKQLTLLKEEFNSLFNQKASLNQLENNIIRFYNRINSEKYTATNNR